MIPELDALVTTQLANEAWMLDGACVGADPEWFFPTPQDRSGNKRAIAICKTCPVRTRCLDWSLRTDSTWGIYGGLTEAQRRQIKENGDAA